MKKLAKRLNELMFKLGLTSTEDAFNIHTFLVPDGETKLISGWDKPTGDLSKLLGAPVLYTDIDIAVNNTDKLKAIVTVTSYIRIKTDEKVGVRVLNTLHYTYFEGDYFEIWQPLQ